MKTYIIGFNKHNGKMGKRTVKARNSAEAVARVTHSVPGSYWHWISVSGVK